MIFSTSARTQGFVASAVAPLLQGKANLLQLRQEIPLNDSELAAVDGRVAALEKLLAQLADVPTPAGPSYWWFELSGSSPFSSFFVSCCTLSASAALAIIRELTSLRWAWIARKSARSSDFFCSFFFCCW
jgi:hypothetical protein